MAAEAFLTAVIDKLSSLIQKEVGLLWGVEQQMQKLQSTLATIKAVIEDAEKKEVQNQAIKVWLRKLKDAAYDLDDILDDCAIEAARSEFESQHSGALVKLTSCITPYSPKNICFRHKIANEMKDVRDRLDSIAEERVKFHLQHVTAAERRDEVLEWRQTSSIVTQPVVYGRDDDQEKIVKHLVEVATMSENISVYPIVGTGGLGKTTLSQLVFNDERVKRHFELKSWVCISDDFNMKRVIKAIIESISVISCEAMDLDPLQRQLREKLKGRRYLIVLDDVWNEDQEKWDSLKYVLACGSKGSSILVTTRLDKVAEMVGTTPAHHLSVLSHDDCWLLFKERAFGHELGQESPSLAAIGRQIVMKCGGVPLAAKALGSLLRFKKADSQWRHVLESDLWNLSEDDNLILPALRLSYFNLPCQFRPCFAYCAFFPKDHIIDKRLLIQLWIANGFISCDRNLEAEDIGNDICNELYMRSFFQDAEKDEFGEIINFKMHDLVHDLAQSVTEGECCALEPGRSCPSSRRIHHVMIPDYPKEFFTTFDGVYELESLRTLYIDWNIFSQNWEVHFCDFSKLCKFYRLRVLSTPYSSLEELPSSIRNLKHLRYLDLSHTEIRSLPTSICRLWNLQNLKLDKCSYLKRLPNQMKLLKNLEHLSIRGCSSLSYLPPNIGQLTCLKTLSMFIVGKRRGCHLDELQRLNLGGELNIKRLEKVGNPMEAKEANLARKSNLRELSLSWEINRELEASRDNCELVFESLEPHPNLKSLKIKGYIGSSFPHWILGNLVSIKLIDCRKCTDFPPLGKLLFLKHLALEKMDVQYLDNESDNGVGEEANGFLSLETLEIRELGNLERLARDERRELFPSLTVLDVYDCHKLSCLPSCLRALKSLKIQLCDEIALFNSISNLSGLNSLNIGAIHKEINFSDGMLRNLTALQRLTIQSVHKLKALPGELVGQVNSLEVLSIWHCGQLEFLPEQGLLHLNSLKSLEVGDCWQLKSMSQGIRRLTSLKRLMIEGCAQVEVPSDDIKHLLSLQHLSLCSLHGRALLNILEGSTHIPEPALRSLHIGGFPYLASLPSSLCSLTSLQSLRIEECPKLTSIPTTIQNLTNLNELQIDNCYELVKRCQKETGEDWDKIAHIPRVYLQYELQI